MRVIGLCLAGVEIVYGIANFKCDAIASSLLG